MSNQERNFLEELKTVLMDEISKRFQMNLIDAKTIELVKELRRLLVGEKEVFEESEFSL